MKKIISLLAVIFFIGGGIVFFNQADNFGLLPEKIYNISVHFLLYGLSSLFFIFAGAILYSAFFKKSKLVHYFAHRDIYYPYDHPPVG